ncbi:MAG: MarR family transcriptional regulator [Thermoplasmatales archaeon]|nr:MAG: MarR family transcriptional regulator [Thermoplasmatales archaeon]
MRIKNKNLHKFFLIILVFFLFILNLQSVCADKYYADITIDIDNSGFVTIDGITNHPDLLAENTEVFTSKKQSYWLLNITKDEDFSDYIFVLTLPKDSSINYIKSSGSVRIEEELGNLIVKGFGQNESFFIIVQYQIKKSLADERLMDIDTLLIIMALILIIGFFLIIILLSKNKRKHLIVVEKPTKDGIEHNLSGLSNRQKNIIELLIERDRPLTQTEIQKELKMPKAAVSRNIHSLEIKDLVEIEKIGMSNLIKIKKH